MERREILRRRIQQRPNAVRLAELRELLEAYGWTLRRISGSHHLFVRGDRRLSIPLRRPTILPVYVRQALRPTEGEDE